MAVLAECDACGKKYRLDDRFAGRTLTCKSCGEEFTVSDRGAAAVAPPRRSEGGSAPPRRAPSGKGASKRSAGKPARARQGEPSAASGKLLTAGGWLSFLGLGMLFLPVLGLQIKWQHLLGDARPIVAAVLTVAGAGCLFTGLMHNLSAAAASAGMVLVLLVVGFVLQTDDEPGAGGGAAPANVAERARQNPRRLPQPGTPQPRNANPAQPAAPPSRSQPGAPAGRGEQTPLVGGRGGGPFHAVGDPGQYVIGFRFEPGEWAGQKVLKTLEPIFSGEQVEDGPHTVVAKPGHAVGGLRVDGREKFVNAVMPVFGKMTDTGLDPDTYYDGPWLGSPQRTPQFLGGDGRRRVIGIYGRKGLVLDAVGLILESDGGGE